MWKGEITMEDEIKIMLVEPDVRTREVYCEVVAGQKGMKLVFATDQQAQAVDYLRAQEVDVVIMEMELAEGDGIGLLDAIEAVPEIKPLVVLATYTTSQATLGYMRMHGVDLVYQKMNVDYSPVHILQMVARLYPYRFCAEPADESATLAGQFRKEMSTYVLRRQVQTELEQMGFRHKMLGFRYLLDAIVLCVERDGATVHVVNWIYPELADRWHTTEARVERAMRWAIECVFVRANIVQLYRHYTFRYDDENGRPSNAEFILNMASKFEKRDGCMKMVTDDREV